MNILRTTDKADGRHPVTVRIDRGFRRGDHLRMRRQPEVIVRTEVEYVFSVRPDLCALGCGGADALLFVEAGGRDFFEFFPEDRLQRFVHDTVIR